MATCTVANASSIYCDNGCCGTEQNRTCCEYTLSEEIIIVICCVGALFVIAVVVALIICLTSHNKDRVTPIRQHRRRQPNENTRIRPPRAVYPTPPPYSEAPPSYEFIETPVDLRPSPSSTDPILPGSVQDSHRQNNRARNNGQHRQQGRRHHRRGRNVVDIETPSDDPPPYVSNVNMDSPLAQGARYTTGSNPQHRREHRRNNENRTVTVEIIDHTGRGSPHPSLASGQITFSNENDREHRLHRTVSERSQFMTPHPNAGRASRRLIDSVTPVTIREITVHSQYTPNVDEQNGREQVRTKNVQQKSILQRNTKIPRPVHRVRAEDASPEVPSRDPTPTGVRKVKNYRTETNAVKPSTSNASASLPLHQINTIKDVASKRRLKTENKIIASTSNIQDTPSNVLTASPNKQDMSSKSLKPTSNVLGMTSSVSKSDAIRNDNRILSPDDDNLLSEDLTVQLRPSAAARRQQRRAILVRLRERKLNASPTDLE